MRRRSTQLEDAHHERRRFGLRALVAFAGVCVLMATLGARLVYLQVIHYERYQTAADHNRIRQEPIAPVRGLILDRNGILLADNQPVQSVSLTREYATDIEQTLDTLATLIPLDTAQRERFLQRLQQRRRPLTPVVVKAGLTETELARVAVNLHRLPGVSLEAQLARHYPKGEALAHTLGYVGRINAREAGQLDADRYRATDVVGKTGIEAEYEAQLHGEPGTHTIETDARGRVTRTLAHTPPQRGQHLQLTLDWPTQAAAYRALAGRRGAIVAIEPATGAVLALLSMPGFDPNQFVLGIDHPSYQALQQSRSRPLFNRALQGQYPPGSTIKPIVGLGALRDGTTRWEDNLWDPGYFQLNEGGRFYRDWKKSGHGRVDLTKAVVESCDTYFYDLAERMGIDAIHTIMTAFGFGDATGIDLPSERGGLVPSKAWKQAQRGQPWYPGETLISGIGQGYMLATPVQLGVAAAMLANQGHVITPYLVAPAATDAPPLTSVDPLTALDIPPADWQRMGAALAAVVSSPRGTAHRVQQALKGYSLAGKTGTAQVLGIKQDEEYDADKIAEWHRDHALFIGYAPVEAPTIAIAVIVENGGSGGATAAPVARAVLDAWFREEFRQERRLEFRSEDAS